MCASVRVCASAACVRACVRVCVRGRVLATVCARISASEGVCMHVNERGRVQIRRERARARARAHVSVRTRMRAKVWVHACEHGRGCPQHICDLHAQLEHRGLRSLQLRLELRGLALCNGELGFELNRFSPRARGCDPAPARRSRWADVQAGGWAGIRAVGHASGRAGMPAGGRAYASEQTGEHASERA